MAADTSYVRQRAAVTTSFLLSNFHCPTCVPAITEALRGLSHIGWISPNVVTSVVTVEHDPVLRIQEMEVALEEYGFDVSCVASDVLDCISDNGHARTTSCWSDWIASPRAASRPPKAQEHQIKLHLRNCEKCRTLGPAWDGVYKPSLDTAYSGSVDQLRKQAPSALVKESEDRGRKRATLAVEGMTCAVCVNAITDELRKQDWVSHVVVSLVSNSATVEFRDENRICHVVQVIEDLGYGATVDNIVDLDVQSQPRERTIHIALDGVYCERCPDRVARSLAGFGRQLKVDWEAPHIIKLCYVPEGPAFTVRQILAAIEATDPALSASIHHAPTLEERSREIQRQYQLHLLYRVILTGIICIPTFVIGVVFMSLVPDGVNQYLEAPWTSGISRMQIAGFIMATPVYFFAADIFHTRAIKEIMALWRHGSGTPIIQRFYRFGSMNTLMSLGTTIAYISSVAQMITAAVHPTLDSDNTSFYFDSVVFLTFFVLVGRLIESFSKARVGDAVEMLARLRQSTAILVDLQHGSESVIEADLLDWGDTVRVAHGASPPADGTIVQGQSTFDESSLTGESQPLKKKVGDQVFSGTINKAGPVVVQINSVAGKSMLDQIVDAVREGQTKRAPMEQIADTMVSHFVPVITLLAIVTWAVWMSLGLSGRLPPDWMDARSGGWVAWSLQFAIAVFVVACPCGLALAAPTAIFVGGGLAAKCGILAKGGGEAFEKASGVECIVFDKTGTLTLGGEPTVTDSEIFLNNVRSDDGVTEHDRLLAALKAVEINSSHPIAKAAVSFCASRTSATASVDNVVEIPGSGMRATCVSDTPFDIAVGNETLMEDLAVYIPPSATTLLQKWKTEAKSIALVATIVVTPSACTATLAAAFSISDPIRPESPAIIRALQSRGIAVWLLSGDNRTTADAVAARVGIAPNNVIAGVLPTQKAEKIAYLQSSLKARSGAELESATRRAKVAMVGDGINDAPALAIADVGIAIGSGADVAISSADFVLLNSDLHGVLNLLDLSRAVFRRIKFNFGWAVVYNCAAIPLAAGCLYPVMSGGNHVRLDPVWASLAMALSSISVVTSSLALRSRLPWVGFRPQSAE
ncbi:hypothetical protein B0I35DRAFT_444338 [Stachybotrys elegans]|uniref:HMA domain-containing protein n=1 Tax=Stachybotrys elegans TaxID=80388 RepID=A0A8K0WKW6_9HYPO|nr:hypothetical protein B0I35DRAFT_444338 [Stachybotrys elegans]